MVLDIVEPPAGRLWAIRDPGQAHYPGSEQEISFTDASQAAAAHRSGPARLACPAAGLRVPAPALTILKRLWALMSAQYR